MKPNEALDKIVSFVGIKEKTDKRYIKLILENVYSAGESQGVKKAKEVYELKSKQ